MVPGLFVRVQEGGIDIAKSDDTRINDEIRAPRVRLIGVDGSQLGLFATHDAQRIADDQNLDLVEIAPNAEPPVCKVMDYGKFKYQPVSYTHLDVYKRQPRPCASSAHVCTPLFPTASRKGTASRPRRSTAWSRRVLSLIHILSTAPFP